MSNLITKDLLSEKLDFWEKLDVTAQKTVQAETAGLVDDYNVGMKARFAVARRLVAIKAVLASPRQGEGRWVKYCRNMLPFSYRSAERAIKDLGRVEGVLPPGIIEAAIAHGKNLISGNGQPSFEPWIVAAEKDPPPKHPTPKQAVEWIARAEEIIQNTPRTRQNGRRRVDATEKAVEAFKTVVNAYKALPAKVRHAWAVSLMGKLMTGLGLPAQRIEPEAVPEEYTKGPGRPRSKKAE